MKNVSNRDLAAAIRLLEYFAMEGNAQSIQQMERLRQARKLGEKLRRL